MTITPTINKNYIRWMINSDIQSVLDIEKNSFEFPWTEEELVMYIKQRDCIGMVIENGCNHVIGFMVYKLLKKSIYLLNLGICPNYRFQGIGQILIKKLISKLKPDHRIKIILEVRETNLGAQLFFKKCGFLCTEIKKNFYNECKEDDYLFEYYID